MKTNALSQLPIDSAGCGDTRLTTDGLFVTLEFEYRNAGEDWIGGISFGSVVAYRFRSEVYSRGYVPESYEAVAEVIDSSWIQELNGIAPTGISDVLRTRHFAIFLGSNGFFEVLAETFDMLAPRRGLLGR